MKWIKTSEQLPKENEMVIIYKQMSSEELFNYVADFGCMPSKRDNVNCAYFFPESDKFLMPDHEGKGVIEFKPSHWMSLPVEPMDEEDYKEEYGNFISYNELDPEFVLDVVESWYVNGMYSDILQNEEGDDLEEIINYERNKLNKNEFKH